MRGGWATLGVTIIAAVVPFAKLANTRSVDHLEGKFLIILKVVEDHGVGLGEGLSLRHQEIMYHMFNLYRGLPFPSPALDSETALGFWHATLSRQEGGIHGFTGHLNKFGGPSIWSMSTT